MNNHWEENENEHVQKNSVKFAPAEVVDQRSDGDVIKQPLFTKRSRTQQRSFYWCSGVILGRLSDITARIAMSQVPDPLGTFLWLQ
jgi:hypothetical protein